LILAIAISVSLEFWAIALNNYLSFAIVPKSNDLLYSDRFTITYTWG
jgi:hypothetical protein